MKTHFSEGEYEERGICGTYSEKISGAWIDVTCKRCLSLRAKYDESLRQSEADRIKQMGEYVEFQSAEAALNKTSKGSE